MGKQIGYKQCQEYFNRSPQAFDEIFELSTISTTRYNPEVKKSTSLNEFLKRPERYTFDFSTKCTGTTNYKKHVYYYDDLSSLMKSEGIKIQHTTLFWIHLILPLVGAAIFLWYYSFASWDSMNKIQAYLQIVSCIWPFLCGVICSISEEMEADCGYQNFFCLSRRKFQAFLSKWCFLMLIGLFSCLIAIVGFALIYGLFPGGKVYTLVVYLEEAAVIWIGQSIVYLIHLVLAFTFGKGVSIGIGILGTLSAFLMLTGMGDGIWMFFPWSWSGRICSYLLLYIAGKNRGAEINPIIINELGICLVVFLILTTAAFLWFWRFEGRRAQSE